MQVRLPDRVAVNWEKEREETGEKSTWSSWDGGTNERPHSLSSTLTTGCREREEVIMVPYGYGSICTIYVHVHVHVQRMLPSTCTCLLAIHCTCIYTFHNMMLVCVVALYRDNVLPRLQHGTETALTVSGE